MAQHPFHDVAVVGIHNTRQARVLEGHDDRTITMEAALGAIADAGLEPRDIDGVVGPYGSDFLYQARVGPVWRSMSPLGIPALLDGVMAIASGMATTVLFATGGAGSYTQRASTAPWTRPTNEFVACYGMYTAAEFALMARRHMHTYGTTAEQMAHAAAVVRNNGHAHPDAVYGGRGPFTAADVLASRMVADPFHLLECAMTSEGGAAVVLTRADRADDLPQRPVYVLGGGTDYYGPAYQHPPGVGPRRPPAARPRGRQRRAPGGGGGLRRRRARARRRRRLRVLRPVLVRDHPPVRGLRLLRPGGGRRLRHLRRHRAGRRPPRSPPTAAPCRSATAARRCSCCSG